MEDHFVHASDCKCERCQPDLIVCPFCSARFGKEVRHLSTEDEKAVEEFIDAQFEADLLEEIEDVEVL
jgi:hypothetical protein